MTVIEHVYQRALEEYFRDWKYRYLFYLVEDKSTSMSNYELFSRYIIETTEDILKNSVQTMGMMSAKTSFDSTLNMQSFKYGLDINSESNRTKVNGTSLYDAVVESCKRMIEQYDELIPYYEIEGVMLIITDGEENNSKMYNLNDLKEAINELSKRGIKCIVPKFDDFGSIDFTEAISVEPFSFSIDNYQRLRCTLLRFADVPPDDILLNPSMGYLK